jgi:hypothetical protein
MGSSLLATHIESWRRLRFPMAMLGPYNKPVPYKVQGVSPSATFHGLLKYSLLRRETLPYPNGIEVSIRNEGCD